MQPHFAIPPLTEEGVQKLVGVRCAVPLLSNSKKVWWVTVKAVKWVTPQDAVVTLSGHRKFGKDKDALLSQLKFEKHVTDPLILSIVKARGESKQ